MGADLRALNRVAFVFLIAAIAGCGNQNTAGPSPKAPGSHPEEVAAPEAPNRSSICDLNHGLEKIVYNIVPKNLILSDTTYGLAIVDRSTGQILCDDYVQGDQEIYPASTIKTLIAIAILRRIDRGEITLKQEITIEQANNPAECVDWSCEVYGNGKKVTVAKLLNDMITISNNLAANQLMDLATKPLINETAKMLGAPSLTVAHKMYNEQNPEPTNNAHNTATARGYVEMFQEIVSGRLKVLSETSRALLIDTLRQQYYHDAFDHTFFHRVTYYHKDGETSQMRGDTGFYYLEQNKNFAVVLVGLQNFPRYSDCTSGTCTTRDSYYALSTIGAEVLKLTESLTGL